MESNDKKLKEYVVEELPQPMVSDSEVTYGTFMEDKLQVAKAVRHGVSFPLFEEIRGNSPLSDKQWANLLGVNIRTFQRYLKDEDHIFNSLQSERIFELAEVFTAGNALFDEEAHFLQWLQLPCLALGGEAPIQLLDSSYGKDLVMAELNRIEHGIFV
ncbi:antitoxin Xre/MbcA/ParS toxin-binding domain-containing protein [Persicobacter sp. CCB-QB2]|uniref:DUF2384 domain-containing protein n=2 Tax=Persicobacter diffluens TaxID=981 RepID=A0AAN4VWZ8_9BACT|nr:antitoxin Xre/MbcA/ParS toxin-binding domain-containing protein [Persicobacter sp. CCB-QB2]GJM61253.1 hypothetical protein PEDI_18050 [Persicobacter diffluens]